MGNFEAYPWSSGFQKNKRHHLLLFANDIICNSLRKKPTYYISIFATQKES